MPNHKGLQVVQLQLQDNSWSLHYSLALNKIFCLLSRAQRIKCAIKKVPHRKAQLIIQPKEFTTDGGHFTEQYTSLVTTYKAVKHFANCLFIYTYKSKGSHILQTHHVWLMLWCKLGPVSYKTTWMDTVSYMLNVGGGMAIMLGNYLIDCHQRTFTQCSHKYCFKNHTFKLIKD